MFPGPFSKHEEKVHTMIGFPIAGIAILAPLLLILSSRYGPVGGAFSWMVVNVVLMTSLIGFVLHFSLKGAWKKWLIYDFGLPFISCLSVTLIARLLWPSELVNLAAHIRTASRFCSVDSYRIPPFSSSSQKGIGDLIR